MSEDDDDDATARPYRWYSWGSGGTGHLAHNDTHDYHTPKLITFRPAIKALRCGGTTTAIIDTDNQLHVCGDNSHHQLSSTTTNTTIPLPVPLALPLGHRVAMVSCGWSHMALVSDDGTLYTCGSNSHNQLGLDQRVPSSRVTQPVLVASLTGPVTSVSCGWRHTLAISDGTVYGWGDNRSGQAGQRTIVKNFTKPTAITITRDDDSGSAVAPVSVSCGWKHSLVLSSTGQLYAFGANNYGQCGQTDGDPIATPSPVPLPATVTVKTVSAGWSHNACVDDTGRVWTFGRADMGQLGRMIGSDKRFTAEPNTVTLPVPVTAVSCGSEHVICVGSDGTVWSWGWNEHGTVSVDQSLQHVWQPVPVTEACDGDGDKRVPLGIADAVECGGAAVFVRVRSDVGRSSAAPN